jgi:hypothetical protein
MPNRLPYEVVARDRDRALRTGAIVSIRPQFRDRVRYARPDAVMVVIADKFDIVNCMDLGGGTFAPKKGWDARAYARIPATWVEVIDPAALASPEFLAGAGLKVDPKRSAPDPDALDGAGFTATLTEVPVPGARK